MEFCQCDSCGFVVFAPTAPDADDACEKCEDGQLRYLANREAGVLLVRRQLLKRLVEVTDEMVSLEEDRAMGADVCPMEEQCLDEEADALWADLARLRQRAKGA
jgi:hypothetical protein